MESTRIAGQPSQSGHLERSSRISDFLFYLIVGLAYSFALSWGVFAATILTVSLLKTFVCCALFLLGWYGIFYNKYTFFAFSVGLLLAIAVVAFVLWRQEFQAQWYLSLRDYLSELVRFFLNRGSQRDSFAGHMEIAVPFLFTLLTALNLRALYNFYALAILGIGVFAIPIVMDWGSSRFAVFLYLFAFLACLIKELNVLALVREGSWELLNARYALSFLPLAAAVFVVALFLPKPSYDPQNRQPFFDPPNLSFMGQSPTKVTTFTEDGGRLGGPAELNNLFVMEVAAEERIYLAGSVRNTYTGSAWTLTGAQREELQPGQNSRIATAPDHPALAERQRYFMRFYGRTTKEVTISTGANRFRTIHTPPFQQAIRFENATRVERDQLGNLNALDTMPAGSVYTQEYISWDQSNQYFLLILRELAAQNTAGSLSQEELAGYLQLPEDLPQRVRDLAAEVTAGQSTDYDKLAALEEYLHAFPYTLNPGPIPRNQDFVDYFLFTGQEGYCVYYATAMAVMARSLGIPTRYLEGFVMPSERNAAGNFTVTGAQAHAWVEAYFPGFGWVAFEPTAPYAASQPDTPPPPNAEQDHPLPTIDEDSRPNLVPDRLNSQSPEDSESSPHGQDSAAGSLAGAVVPLALLILAAVALLCVWWVCHRADKYRQTLEDTDSLPNNQAAVLWFTRLLKTAKFLGFPIRKQETAIAYAGRVGDELPLTVHMEELALVFSKAAYSVQPVTEQERDKLRLSYQEMVRQLRGDKRYDPKFYLNRYVLHRF